MPHDPWRVADTRAWLVKAANDLRAADVEFRATPPLLEDIAFHAQQAAEKALKAFLTWHETPFRKTHSLEEIGEQCITIDANLSSFTDRPSRTPDGVRLEVPLSGRAGVAHRGGSG